MTSAQNGDVRIVWYGQEAKNFNEGEVICFINASIKAELSDATQLISLAKGTEFANINAQIISGVTLKTRSYTTNNLNVLTTLTSILYPNPFSEYSNLQIQIPETGRLSLIIINQLGQEVTKIEKTISSTGALIQPIDRQMLKNNGIYFYRITLDGNTRSYSHVGRFIVSE
jgi:hypothetical protein